MRILVPTEIVEYLYHKKIPVIQKASTDKLLPRITFKDEKINVLDIEGNNDAIINSSESLDAHNDTDDSDSDT